RGRVVHYGVHRRRVQRLQPRSVLRALGAQERVGRLEGDDRNQRLGNRDGQLHLMLPFNPARFGHRAAHAPAPASYESESVTYFAAMSVQPDAARKGLINTLIA